MVGIFESLLTQFELCVHTFIQQGKVSGLNVLSMGINCSPLKMQFVHGIPHVRIYCTMGVNSSL